MYVYHSSDFRSKMAGACDGLVAKMSVAPHGQSFVLSLPQDPTFIASVRLEHGKEEMDSRTFSEPLISWREYNNLLAQQPRLTF